ncbi:hypothetical protein [Microbulbifer sp.]|uniref:hypothetical protein n=1 Tax=Microbulbifer sp. TaxID=1908541 RepID=UPI0025906E7F|nr:hypothetical protein [Microbulbifer sp.]
MKMFSSRLFWFFVSAVGASSAYYIWTSTETSEYPQVEVNQVKGKTGTAVPPEKNEEKIKYGTVFGESIESRKLSKEKARLVIDVYGQVDVKGYEDNWCATQELTEESHVSASSEWNEWLRGLGYEAFGIQRRPNSTSYQYYDLPTLNTLAKQGDLQAIHQLLERPEVGQDEKKSLAYHALVYGATTSIAEFATASYPDLSHLIKSGKPEAAKNLLIEQLAWEEYAAMRGDHIAFKVGIRGYQERLERFGNTLRLNDSDLAMISSKANEHLNAINMKRSELGLGELPESPKYAKKVFERTVGEVLSEGYEENYGRKFLQTNECIDKHIEFFTKLRESREERLTASSE